MNVRLCDKYRPRTLDDVVGQPCLRYLRGLVDQPHSTCLLFESPEGGVGKTSTALALAAELGRQDEMSGLTIQPCSDLSVERARELFDTTLRYRPFEGRGWRVLMLEELDWASVQCQRFLKVALETRLPSRCVVVATSNDAGKLDRPLLQRFQLYRFQSGEAFRDACQQRLAQIWAVESDGEDLPPHWMLWGDIGGDGFSMRVALGQMQDWLALRGVVRV